MGTLPFLAAGINACSSSLGVNFINIMCNAHENLCFTPFFTPLKASEIYIVEHKVVSHPTFNYCEINLQKIELKEVSVSFEKIELPCFFIADK